MELSKSLLLKNKIGFGTWQIGGETNFGARQTGWGPVDETEAIKAIHFALDNGITFFDTADAYGKGKSETILGKALKQKPAVGVKICTKAGSRWDIDGSFYQDFSPQWIEQALTASLKRMRVENIDTLLLHSPDINFDWANYDLSVFEKLIERGVINRYGVSIKSVKALPSIHANKVGSIVEAIFNVLDRRLYDASKTNSSHQYIARVPLSSGFLTEKVFTADPVFGKTDIRQYIPPNDVQWLVENVRKLSFLRDLPGGIEVSALRFCISFETIAVAIPGMYKVKQVEAAVLANQLGKLSSDILKKIEETITSLPDSWK